MLRKEYPQLGDKSTMHRYSLNCLWLSFGMQEREKGKNMADEVTKEEGTQKTLGMGVWIAIAVAALVVGILIGRFALGGGGGSALNKTSLSEGELDTVVATYTQNGAANSLTARQVIEMTSSLESAKDEDGNYKIPSADNILYAVRNTIAIGEAESRGINPTDEELLNYAEETLGQTPDFESIATSNNIDVDTVKKLLTDSYRIHELQNQVGGDKGGEEPEYPTEPEYAKTNDAGEALSDEQIQKNQDEAHKKPNADYYNYIVKLAGDEWDAEAGKWKSEDGEYAKALASYEVKKDSATYEAAYAAYQVAYSKYSEAQSARYQAVTDYLSDLYGKSSITINTLAQ